MSKLNVGVGADFPVDSAEASPGEDERYGCDDRPFRRRRHYGWHRGRFFFAGPLIIIAFIALISLAVSKPLVILGLIAVAALLFAARHHRHDWHDHGRGDDDRRGYDPRDRGDFSRRDRRDDGPQPDAPNNTAPGGA